MAPEKGMQLEPKLQGKTEQEIEEYCNEIHPIDFCRAKKAQKSAIELVPIDLLSNSCDIPANEAAWVGEVLLNEPNPSDPSATSSFPDSNLPSSIPVAINFSAEDPNNPSEDLLMCVGSQIAWEIRSKLFLEAGLTTSAGIAPNMMLAKLASSQFKPNQQSIVRPSVAKQFLSPIKLSKVSGFGPKSQEIVEEAGLSCVGQLQQLSYVRLTGQFGENLGNWLYNISQGIDYTPVEESGPPKSIGQSKRQQTKLESEKLALLRWEAEQLYERIVEDSTEYHRRPSSLVLSYIGATWEQTAGRRTTIPYINELPNPAEFLYKTAQQLMQGFVPNSTCKCLSLTATNFVPLQGQTLVKYFTNGNSNNSNNKINTAPGSSSTNNSNNYNNSSSSSNGHGNNVDGKAKGSKKVSRGSIAQMFANFGSKSTQNNGNGIVSSSNHSQQPVDLSEINALEELEMEEMQPEPENNASRHSFFSGKSNLDNDTDDLIEKLFDLSDDEPSNSVHQTPQHNEAQPNSCKNSTAENHNESMPTLDYLCAECGKTIPESNRREHNDYHFAAQLQGQIRAQDREAREKSLQQQANQRRKQNSNNSKSNKPNHSATSSSNFPSLTQFFKPN
jgi:hypothetical protein